MPMTRSRGKPVTVFVTQHITSSGFETTTTIADIVQQVARQIKQHCPTAIVVVVSNPLDVMCWVTKTVTGFPRERVIGMAGGRQPAPHRALLPEALAVSVADVPAVGFGGRRHTHGALPPPTTGS